MHLTPVKIPGKRRPKAHVSDEPSNLAPNQDIARPTNSGSKRPSSSSSSSRHRPRIRPRGSSIERQLPLEILEAILVYSQNVNLAYASPRFGWLLSGLSTRRSIFLQAFDKTFTMMARPKSVDTPNPSPPGTPDRSRNEGGPNGFKVCCTSPYRSA